MGYYKYRYSPTRRLLHPTFKKNINLIGIELQVRLTIPGHRIAPRRLTGRWPCRITGSR